jgi:hypothetical protein
VLVPFAGPSTARSTNLTDSARGDGLAAVGRQQDALCNGRGDGSVESVDLVSIDQQHAGAYARRVTPAA